jgi:hypothetical protein
MDRMGNDWWDSTTPIRCSGDGVENHKTIGIGNEASENTNTVTPRRSSRTFGVQWTRCYAKGE